MHEAKLVALAQKIDEIEIVLQLASSSARVSPPSSLSQYCSEVDKSVLIMMVSGMVDCLQTQVPHCTKTLQAGRPIGSAQLPPDSNVNNLPPNIRNL